MSRILIGLSLGTAFFVAACSYESTDRIAGGPMAAGVPVLAAITGDSVLGAAPIGGSSSVLITPSGAVR